MTRSLKKVTEGFFYGFNGQMKDDKVYGLEGTAYSFEYRIHDARLGRFISVATLAPEYPWDSTYAFADNGVIRCRDLEGREKDIAIFMGNDETMVCLAMQVKVEVLEKALITY